MKLKKSEINLLLVVIGLGLAALSYFSVYNNLKEKTATIESENAVLQQEVDRLQDLADHQAEYVAETETMNEEIAEIDKQFEASFLPEDEILYVDSIEKAFSATVGTVSMPGSQLVDVPYTPSAELLPVDSTPVATETTEEADVEAADADAPAAPAVAVPDIQLYGTPVSISFVAPYQNIKEILKTMNEDEMRKSIDSLSLAFDGESGDLVGNLAFKMYSITGTGKEYQTPQIDGVMFGTNNIFNSADKKTAIQNAKAEEAESEGDAE